MVYFVKEYSKKFLSKNWKVDQGQVVHTGIRINSFVKEKKKDYVCYMCRLPLDPTEPLGTDRPLYHADVRLDHLQRLFGFHNVDTVGTGDGNTID